MYPSYDYRVNTHVSTRLKGVLNNATVVRDTSILTYEDSSYFPQVGRVTAVYIDKLHNMAYRWDDTLNKYVPLNDDSSSSKIYVNTGMLVSADAPVQTNVLWIDISDSYFVKYYDGNMWRKSNLVMLCNPDDYKDNEWIIIPDETKPKPDDDSWIIIPDKDPNPCPPCEENNPPITSSNDDAWMVFPDDD